MTNPSRDFNVWTGDDGLWRYLHLADAPPTPLVELPPTANRLAGEGVRILLKLMCYLPFFNGKQIPVLFILKAANAAGRLTGVHTVVEATSGNTGFALLMYAPFFGIANVVILTPDDTPQTKIDMLEQFGATVQKYRRGDVSGVKLARTMGEQEGWLNLGQYERNENILGHALITGAQLVEQMCAIQTVPSLLCAGLGTTGTLRGSHQAFEEAGLHVPTVGLICATGNVVSGVRSEKGLSEVPLAELPGVDHRIEVTAEETGAHQTILHKHRLLLGAPSAFLLAGMLKFLEGERDAGRLDALRSPQTNEVVAVGVAMDPFFAYM